LLLASGVKVTEAKVDQTEFDVVVVSPAVRDE
jgi:hypothetical protein